MTVIVRKPWAQRVPREKPSSPTIIVFSSETVHDENILSPTRLEINFPIPISHTLMVPSSEPKTNLVPSEVTARL
jgi:hypothetical protein